MKEQKICHQPDINQAWTFNKWYERYTTLIEYSIKMKKLNLEPQARDYLSKFPVSTSEAPPILELQSNISPYFL